ncbi:Winged helix-turn-helix protein [Vibrio crassostreae]|nr:winged helix-turn-helix protein [Vibrio crassostreae]CAK2421995.1 Winged helix-turn-helix protein [Vibrio crassostreae]CAK2500767.1 Winged helix-turn-helix protein [Vibrio crassostreae]CAK3026935.1 Winged helix-turn-helix protein [Vibrio crassostreae]CAK3547311.1 Winged helix-turn-helix protein [Vibrio crassostreae]
MSAVQTMPVIEYLAEQAYFHTHQIIAYIEAEFAIRYRVMGMNKWPHHNGFSYNKPKGPHKFCPEMQRAFCLETKDRALSTRAKGTPNLRWSGLSSNRVGERYS